jgi:hypothetical protein
LKQIFLISAKAQNGKDSTSDIMMKYLDGKSTKVSLARDLKSICQEYLGWDGSKNELGREILQKTGTDKIRKEFGWEVFHAHRVYETIKIIEDAYDYIFVPDTRFRNEVFYLQAMFPDKVTTIRVKRNNFISPLTKEQQIHISETDLDDFKFDYYIKSDSGLNNLEKVVLNEIISKINRIPQPIEPDFDPPMKIK